MMCGEYGDTFGRKHFHGIIFNHSFDDVVPTGTVSKKGNPLHTSASLQAVWKKGFVQLEEITFDLALYVGSYVTDYLDSVDVNLGHKNASMVVLVLVLVSLGFLSIGARF